MPNRRKSEVVLGVDFVQSSVSPLLKAAGFRKRGRSYNRGVGDGMVHVINFQTGQYPIGEGYEIPGLRESLYGYFTVNLGVHLPQVWNAGSNLQAPKFLQEYHCEIRSQLGELIADEGEMWWSAVQEIQETASSFPGFFKEYALPFLDRFLVSEDVIAEWRSRGKLPFCNAGRSGLVCGVLMSNRGQTAEAQAAFKEVIATSKHSGFKEHVREVASGLGHTV